jgi:hypothetical protein
VKEATLNDLIQDVMDINIGKSPMIPYQLHEGLTRLTKAFNNLDQCELFLRNYRAQRFPNQL